MSADAPERPPEPEIPETPDNDPSQGDDEPGHTTMEDIDAADSSRGGAEGEKVSDGAPDDLEVPVDGDQGTGIPGAEADGDGAREESAEPIDSGSSDHNELGHTTAGDIDAVGDADEDAHDGDAGSRPLKSEDSLSAPADGGAAIGVDLGDPCSQGKRSAESKGAGEEHPHTAETAVDEELAAPEKGGEATPRDGDGDVTGTTAEPNGSYGDTEESADRRGPDEREDDGSADVRGRDSSAEDSHGEKTPTAGEAEADGAAPVEQTGSADMAGGAGKRADPLDDGKIAGRLKQSNSGLITGDSALTEPHDGSQGASASVQVEEEAHTSTRTLESEDAERLAEAGEPNDAPGPFKVTELEEPLDAGAPMETAVSDEAPLRSDGDGVAEYRAREQSAPTEVPVPAADLEADPALDAISDDGTFADVPDSRPEAASIYDAPEADGKPPEAGNGAGASDSASPVGAESSLDSQFVDGRIKELDDRQGGEGHAPGRHLYPDAQALQDRLGTPKLDSSGNPRLNSAGHVKSEKNIDPLNGKRVDAVTGRKHRVGSYATRFDHAEDMVKADQYFRDEIQRTGEPPNTELPIEDVLGPEGHERFTGFYRSPVNLNEFLPVDFEGGTIRAVYRFENGDWKLTTMYANPAPGRHP
ncbi:hypothetical protein [Streptomyces sp. NPDC057381]|uniref:hypothetical protein n=1 Tax=Streptomyces sp. NPDC057381 TaxID=3346111 RepID=UPI003624C40F